MCISRRCGVVCDRGEAVASPLRVLVTQSPADVRGMWPARRRRSPAHPGKRHSPSRGVSAGIWWECRQPAWRRRPSYRRSGQRQRPRVEIEQRGSDAEGDTAGFVCLLQRLQLFLIAEKGAIHRFFSDRLENTRATLRLRLRGPAQRSADQRRPQKPPKSPLVLRSKR